MLLTFSCCCFCLGSVVVNIVVIFFWFTSFFLVDFGGFVLSLGVVVVGLAEGCSCLVLILANSGWVVKVGVVVVVVVWNFLDINVCWFELDSGFGRSAPACFSGLPRNVVFSS